MFRIDVATAAGVIPTPAAAGTPGYFTNGNPATSTPSTVVDADFLNMMQEELYAIATALGAAASKTTRNQALTAIQQMIQRQSVNFANDTGSSNAYVGAYTPVIASYTDGMILRLSIANTNSGASTFNGGAGAVTVLRADSSALAAGDIPAGATVSFQYKSSTNRFLVVSVTQNFSANTVQQQAGNYAAAGGTANAITATYTPAVGSHVVGMPLRVKIASNNTAAATFNPGAGAVAIVTPLGAALKANDLRAGAIAELVYDGTSYQLRGVYYPTGSITTITGNTTVTTADFGVVFRASGLAADATLSLPALAGVPDGFEFTVWNDTKATPSGTAFKVIIDPNSTEQLDALATRDVWEQVRVTIIKENGMWRTKAGAYRYYSGEQTMTLSGALALTHGLGVRPARVWFELRCTAADGNFVTDDIITTNGFGAGYDSGSNWDGWTTYSDGTTINIRFGNTTVGKFANKSAGTQIGITAANWKMRVFAEA